MRRRAKRENVGVALFPFLAVLICTMGALIVLLVMNVQQASVEAKTIAAEQAKAKEPSPQELKKQQEALEEARWRQEQLEKSRTQRQEELQNSRLALSHLEDHIRRLTAKGNELMELLEKVKAGKQAKDQDLDAAKRELEKIKQELAKKKDELEKKKKDVANTEKWYALIPYDGPNGTRRMPIYIECVAEGVVIQPEGVLLTAEDFRGEPSPGNPLDAALRVKREYIMKVTGGKAAEPYPLLVVRPSGVIAYNVAKEFMKKSWEDEFGYELISEEKKLDFGTRDPNLDLVMSQEMDRARKRQALMVRDMPRVFKDEMVPRSFAPEDNAEVQRRREAVSGNGLGNGGAGNGIGTGRGRSGIGGIGNGTGAGGNSGVGGGTGGIGAAPSGTGSGTGGLTLSSPSRPGGTGAGGPMIGPGSAGGPYGPGDGSGDTQNPAGLAGTNTVGAGPSGSGGVGPGGSGTGGSAYGGSGGRSGNKSPGGVRPAQSEPGGTEPGSGSYAGGTAGGTSEKGTTSRPGSPGTNSSNSDPSSTSGGSPSGSSGGSSEASSGAVAGPTSLGSPGSGQPGGQSMPNISMNAGSSSQPPPGSQKAGKKKGRGGPGDSAKGKNWGLPEAQRHVTGVTRPIRVAMQKDKLILLPERDDRRPQEIGLSSTMSSQELDILISGVHRQMKGWGIAVDGGYWKPALSVDVQPGADDRFAELQSALQGSGIEVQRKIR